MRKDPPFNKEYIYSTYILEAAKRKGVLIVNDPQSLRDCNEKIFATEFKQFTPPLIVTKNIKLLKAFLTQNEEVVYKPLDGMGGESIFKVNYKDENIKRNTGNADQIWNAYNHGTKIYCRHQQWR